MANRLPLIPVRTYKTEANAIKAAETACGHLSVRYFIAAHTDERFFPVFVGQAAVEAGVHFSFNVVG